MEGTAVPGPVCDHRSARWAKSLSRAGNDGPVLAGAQGNSLWTGPAAAATAGHSAGPRRTHVALVLFQLQVRHVPEKLKVIIRRCDQQSAWQGLRPILLVFPLPGPGLAGQDSPLPLPPLSTQLTLPSFGALSSRLCVVAAQLWDAIPAPTGRCLVCLLHRCSQCPAQGVAQNRCPVKTCGSDGSSPFFVTPNTAQRPASTAGPHVRPGKCVTYRCSRRQGKEAWAGV